MRSRWDRKEDSLDLLLNTLCDVFGSFIMIALILVLPVELKHISTPVTDKETLDRRIAAAEAELTAIDNRIRQITPDPKVRDAESEKHSLEVSIAALKERSDALDSERAKEMISSNRDIAKEDQAIQDAIRKAQLERESAKNALDAASDLLTQLKSRKEAINGKISEAKQARVQEMRLPRERETSKGPANVIFRYGQIYPLESSFDPIIENRSSLERIDEGEDSEKVIPIEGKGISGKDENAIREWAKTIPSDAFAACYVYVDSIEAFRAFRKIIQSNNVDLGWEPVESGRTLRFGTNGSSPKPQ